MLIDAFMFFDELELLEIRLHELDSIVERFILVEAPITHSGREKPLVFLENKHLFERFLPKIEHLIVLDMPSTGDPWIRERWQRAAIMRGINPSWNSYDLMISSDVDEIPKASSIRAALPISGVRSLGMDSYGVFVNAYAGPWDHAKIGPLIDFRNHGPNQIRHSGHPPIKDAEKVAPKMIFMENPSEDEFKKLMNVTFRDIFLAK
jgi:beta-1,4-mannosyl-glycoprotein beta-1,4-N-acetylglucosaminyltransferase